MHALACRTLFRRLQMMHAVAVLRVLIARQMGGIMQTLVAVPRCCLLDLGNTVIPQCKRKEPQNLRSFLLFKAAS